VVKLYQQLCAVNSNWQDKARVLASSKHIRTEVSSCTSLTCAASMHWLTLDTTVQCQNYKYTAHQYITFVEDNRNITSISVSSVVAIRPVH